MLYLSRNRRVTLKVPRLSASFAEADTLLLTSTIDLTTTEIAVDVVSLSPLYITVEIDIPQLQYGEYRYELRSGMETLSRGLAICENDNNEIEYGNKEEYIQYE